MANAMLVGQWIAVLNSLYSFFYLGGAFLDYIDYLNGGSIRTLWFAAYAANLVLNTFLFMRLLKRDRSIIWLWTFLTIILLIVRIACINAYKFQPVLHTVHIVVNYYIALSLLVMIEVYKHLKKAQPDQTTDQFNRNGTRQAYAPSPQPVENATSVLTDMDIQVQALQTSPYLYALIDEYLPSAPELPSGHIPETRIVITQE